MRHALLACSPRRFGNAALRLRIVAAAILIGCISSFPVHTSATPPSKLGPIGERLASACKVQEAAARTVLATYAVRLEGQVATHGCGVLGVYGALVGQGEGAEQVLSNLEAEGKLMQAAAGLVTGSPRFVSMIAASPLDAEALIGTLADLADPERLRLTGALAGVVERYWPGGIASTKGILALSLALSLTMDPGSATALGRALDQIHHLVTPADLPLIATLVQATSVVRPDLAPEKRLKDPVHTVAALSRAAPGALDFFRQTPAALQYAVMFLPPRPEEWRDASQFSDDQLQRLSQDYLDVMAGAYEFLERQGGPVRALTVLDGLQGIVMDAVTRYGNGEEIQGFLKGFAESPVFAAMAGAACGPEWQARIGDLIQAFAPPLSCVAERQDLGATATAAAAPTWKVCPTDPRWEGHLGRTARWYAQTPWAATFLTSATNPVASLRVLHDLPRVMEPLDQRTRKRVGLVLTELEGDPAVTGSFVVDLAATDFLLWLSSADDADTVVQHDPEVRSGRTTSKSVYILITSYPSRDDPSLLEVYRQTGMVDLAHVHQLTRASAADLSAHRFTRMEAAVGALETATDLVDYAGLAAAPITGGASIAIVAARKSGMAALRWAARTAAQRSARTVAGLAGRNGAKVAIREWKHLLVTETRGPGRPPTGSRTIRRWIDNAGTASDVMVAGPILLGFLVANLWGNDDALESCPR